MPSFNRLAVPLRNVELSRNDVDVLCDFAVKAPRQASSESGYQRTAEQYQPPIELSALVCRSVNQTGEFEPARSQLDYEILRCFGVESATRLGRYPRNASSKFSLKRSFGSGSVGQGHFSFDVELGENGVTFQSRFSPQSPSLTVAKGDFSLPWRWLSRLDESTERDGLTGEFVSFVASSMFAQSSGPLAFTARYLPAGRAGVMQAHSVAVQSLIAGASRIGLRHEPPMPSLTGVLSDFLGSLVDLAQVQGLKDLDEQATGLAPLIGGHVVVQQSQINYPSFAFRPVGWDRNLPLMNTSSMVSELAPVDLFLRYFVGREDTIIIDEPEAHLHPQKQVEFTRFLAGVVKSGVRVVITTHSEWVLEELANLVLMSEVPKDRRSGIDGAACALTPDQVGTWFFEPGSDGNGSKVREMKLDKSEGTFPSGFGLISTELYNRYATIANRIEGGREN